MAVLLNARRVAALHDIDAQSPRQLAAQPHRALSADQQTAGQLQPQIPEGDGVVGPGVAAAPPQQGAHAGQQLLRLKGLGEIIVRPAVQPLDPVGQVAAGRQHQHRHGVAPGAQLPQHVHFGHQTRRWNPKMAEYIFTERNGIYIIDLQKTVKKLEEAYNFVREATQDGGEILFVGTKKQAQLSIKEEAQRCGMPYVDARWLGGMLTNFTTIRRRIDRLNQLRKMREDGTFDLLPKKEVIKLNAEIEKLEKFLGGIQNMKKMPVAMFVVDPRKEKIAVSEAHKLNIPVVAIVDTNCDPDDVDYVIPGNDDAIRAVKLLSGAMADAVLEAHQGAVGSAEVADQEAEEAAE